MKDHRFPDPKTHELLLELVRTGPMRPKGAQWVQFYALERRGLARKVDMQVYATDLGKKMIGETGG